jgi:4-amino-4-deoxy-L-arabinose transferase-like glycosyltransferase
VERVLKYKFQVLLGILLILLYFGLRLPNLTLQPIFADEAIYIRWAQVMRAEPTLRFLPITDGKTPLYMWTLIPFLKVFEDPLFAGRFLSILAGFTTLIGIFLLSRKVFGIKTAFWASLMYVVTPYTVFFDRMALVDSMLASFTIWSIYLSLLLAQKLRLDLAMILGYLLGGALLTKTPAMMHLLILPISILGFTKGRKNLVKLVSLWIVAIVIAIVMYNLLRLGPSFHMLSARNADYVFSLNELSGRPLDPFIPHLLDISDWFPKLLTWPILISWFVGVWVVLKKQQRNGLVILLWSLAPIIILMAFLKTFTARYLLLSIPPILVLSAYGIERISKKITSLILLLIILVPTLHFDYQLLASPPPNGLPRAERIGYFEDWTAGYGFKEIAEFLIQKRKEGPVVVGTEGYFGTLPDGLQIYLDKEDIRVVPGKGVISEELQKAAASNQTFFIGNKNRVGEIVKNGEFLKEYPKKSPLDGRPQDAIVVYQVIP